MRLIRSRFRQAGYTLMEMMAATAVTSVLLVGVAGAVIGNQKAQSAEADVRASASSARGALAFLEQHLQMAGYGIEPRYAFLFSANSDNGGIYGAPDAIADSSSPPLRSDILEFQYRDPLFLYRGRFNGSNASAATLELGNGGGSAPTALRTPLRTGERLLVICPGAQRFAYMRVRADAAVGATSIQTAGFDTTSWPHLGGLPPSDISNPCFGSTTSGLASTTEAVFITRIRYFRISLQRTEEVYAGARRTRPYLMYFDGATTSPLVRDIEDFQVAYMMNRPTAATTPGPDNACSATNGWPDNFTFGNGGNLQNGVDGWKVERTGADPAGCAPNPAVAAPQFANDYAAAVRFNAHPANIRRVRVSLVAVGQADGAAKFTPRMALENNVPTSVLQLRRDGLFRVPFVVNVPTRNLAARSMFTPAIVANGGTNVWGG
ncbi:MAG: PilW family protein [Myxococcales bacterium]